MGRGKRGKGREEGWTYKNCLDGSTGRRMIKEEREGKGEDGQMDSEIGS